MRSWFHSRALDKAISALLKTSGAVKACAGYEAIPAHKHRSLPSATRARRKRSTVHGTILGRVFEHKSESAIRESTGNIGFTHGFADDVADVASVASLLRFAVAPVKYFYQHD